MSGQSKVVCISAYLTLLTPTGVVASDDLSVGLGARYWQTVESLSNNEERGGSVVFSMQTKVNDYFKGQLDVDFASKGFSGLEDDSDVVSIPQLYLLLGGAIYAGVGVGISLSCTDNVGNASQPFAAARVGLELPTPWSDLSFDLNGTYLVNAFDELGDEETDAFTLGFVVRFSGTLER